VVNNYIKRIDLLENVSGVESLYTYNALHYEVLQGDKKGLESIRVNDQYRIEFSTVRVESETVVTICNILEYNMQIVRKDKRLIERFNSIRKIAAVF